MKAPLSRSSGFLSIEWQNPRPLKVGETLNLNLQAVGISGSFSYFYYMVCMMGHRGGQAERVSKERPSGWVAAPGLRMASEEHPAPLQILSRGQIVSVHREPKTHLTSISVFVDHRLVPSFHLVAFYYHGGVPVANSLRVDVQAGGCEGKVTGIGRDGVCVRPGRIKRED